MCLAMLSLRHMHQLAAYFGEPAQYEREKIFGESQVQNTQLTSYKHITCMLVKVEKALARRRYYRYFKIST